MLRLRLDQLLVIRGLVGSRSQAAALIKLGKIKVSGRRATQPGQLIDQKVDIEVTKERYVSRAAYKLASVAPKLSLDFKHNVVLDVGASTGGFTDFALQRGATRVYAVDIGTKQLAAKLKVDSRVVSMEKTDIRQVTSLPESVDLAVVDVSFISLRLILPGLIMLLAKNGQILAMVKPQFETGEPNVTHKGVIKNDTIRRQILKDFEAWAKDQFQIIAKADSKIAGTKGNIERFYLLKPTQ